MLFTTFARGLTALLLPLAVAAKGEAAGQDLKTVLEHQKNLTTFSALIKKYPDILLQLPSDDGVTIIAPSNEAFKNIPYTSLNGVWDEDNKDTTISLLQYHIIKGTVTTDKLESGPTAMYPTLLTASKFTNVTGGQNVLITKQSGNVVVLTSSMGSRCTVVQKDIAFDGGVIQVSDNLLVPPAPLGKTADSFKLESFLGGLYAAKLMPSIQNRGNVTIFAPLDTALAAVGGNLEHLDVDHLQRVFGYHVIPDKVLVSSALINDTVLDTLARGASNQSTESVTIRQAGNNKYINAVQLAQPDILLANGILHIVSGVLNPDAPSATPNPSLATQAPAFPASSAGHVFTSALPCSTDCPVTSGGSGTATDDATPTSTEFTSKSSSAFAAPARATGHVAGAALGLLGVGAGMVLI